DNRSFTPAVIAPSFATAQYVRRYSTLGGSATATTSPMRTPRTARPTATSSEMRSMSTYDSGWPSGATYAVRSPKRRAASATVSGSVGGGVRATMAEAYKSTRGSVVRRISAGAPARQRDLRPQGRKTMGRLLDAGIRVFGERGFHAARVDDIV